MVFHDFWNICSYNLRPLRICSSIKILFYKKGLILLVDSLKFFHVIRTDSQKFRYIDFKIFNDFIHIFMSNHHLLMMNFDLERFFGLYQFRDVIENFDSLTGKG